MPIVNLDPEDRTKAVEAALQLTTVGGNEKLPYDELRKNAGQHLLEITGVSAPEPISDSNFSTPVSPSPEILPPSA